MGNKRCYVIVLITTFMLFLRPTASASADQSHDLRVRLQMQVSEYRLNETDFAHALAATASKFNLPIGIEWVRSPETLRKVNRSWKNASVEQILTSIVDSQPGYGLDMDDGIVHVYLKKMSLEKKDFLNLKVDRFELSHEVVETGNRKLHEVVKSKITPVQAQSQRPAGMGYSQATNIGDPEFNLSVEDASVRQIIDKLALSSDRKIWIVTYTEDGVDPGTGYRRTTTLWNNSKIPDSEQPIWDMFRWSDRIPQT
jgi:hypothetical protein